ncbi:hypothetical protein [Aeromicrobium sp. IC_218]|uniref:hypothetical protein n=1 Tax=Aeromicrobium sp. IC_218 TaxID=2545468 RepID=UPI00103F1EDC|nr:hypothetical protein [Aeromicrobium sp. IC_218]TCI99355.1 hypothetical protein E0W78_06360 [Aeromicrobium sp. IC_218]
MTRRGTRLLVIGTALVAFAAGVLLWAALDLVATGYRVDEEGTSSRQADMLLGWGGLALGLVLGSVGAVVLGLAQAHIHREQRDLTEHRVG